MKKKCATSKCLTIYVEANYTLPFALLDKITQELEDTQPVDASWDSKFDRDAEFSISYTAPAFSGEYPSEMIKCFSDCEKIIQQMVENYES